MDADSTTPPLDADLTSDSDSTSDAGLTSDSTDTPSDDEPLVMGLPVILPTQTEYRCPGESHSIPRSVHLSRLAAFYPGCRECQHRSDTGQLPPKTVARIQQVERRVSQKQTVFQTDGVRGVFMNQFTPSLAGRIARTFAAQLWSDLPLAGRLDEQPRSQATRPGPSVVVGYDERPSSPAVLATVIDALRLMGCQILDVGLVSRPCFCFAVDHLQSAGGIFVTGSGHESSWAGLDLFSEGAMPLSLGTGLEKIESALAQSVARPTRSAGFQRSFQPVLPYEAGLWKHFHALRPLKVVAAVRPRPVRKTLRKLFKKLPCQLIEVEGDATPDARLKLEALRERTGVRILHREAHLGILIDDDGARCEFFNELGERIPQEQLAAFLTEAVRSDVPRANIVVDQSISEATDSDNPDSQSATQPRSSAGAVAREMVRSKATLGVERNDRYWFRENFPACDAVVALARVLQGLSRNDAPFSERLR